MAEDIETTEPEKPPYEGFQAALKRASVKTIEDRIAAVVGEVAGAGAAVECKIHELQYPASHAFFREMVSMTVTVTGPAKEWRTERRPPAGSKVDLEAVRARSIAEREKEVDDWMAERTRGSGEARG